ncbi:hypothetical protein [Aeromonas australiensis]|nr:hypothetical protein [Aeromonas australiensis]
MKTTPFPLAVSQAQAHTEVEVGRMVSKQLIDMSDFANQALKRTMMG